MIAASDVRAGMALRLDGKLYRVLEATRHAGSGQMHGFIDLKLQDIEFAHFADRHFRQSDRLEEISLSKRRMQYLYSDDEACVFMDSLTFDQVRVPRTGLSGAERFLTEGMDVPVELVDDQAISVDFPKVVDIRVRQTGPGVHGGQDTTLKPAILENGVEVLVPHFVETGDLVRVETEKAKYIERVGAKKM
jgi:elongation factor P